MSHLGSVSQPKAAAEKARLKLSERKSAALGVAGLRGCDSIDEITKAFLA
jgi:hypothetical protein